MDQNTQAIQGAAIQQTQQAPPPTPEDTLAATKQALLKKKNPTLSEELAQGYDPASISQALAVVNPNGSTSDVKVGGALNTNNYSDLCLKFVDDETGNNDRSPTAYADYQKNASSGNIQTEGTPPKGARVYFAPTPGNPAGHVGLSLGGGQFEGATTNQGIKTFSIGDWEKYASQRFIGWAPPNSK